MEIKRRSLISLLNSDGDVNDRECLVYILLTVVLGKRPTRYKTYLYIS